MFRREYWTLFFFTLLFVLLGCNRRAVTETSRPSSEFPRIAKANGKPVPGYRIITHKVPLDCAGCLGVDFALIEQVHPTQEELTDLAVDLHAKNPSRKIYIIDSPNGIDKYIAFLAKPLVEKV